MKRSIVTLIVIPIVILVITLGLNIVSEFNIRFLFHLLGYELIIYSFIFIIWALVQYIKYK